MLDPKLSEAGGKIPKWQPRSRRGQYVGVSPVHAENIALVRNLTTGRLSPCYHVVFDDWFETCYATEDQEPSFWKDMCVFDSYEPAYDAIDNPPPLADEWLTAEEIAHKRSSRPVRQGRRLYQDLQTKSKDIKDDLAYEPPPSASVSPAQTREPSSQTREPSVSPRELHNWSREPPEVHTSSGSSSLSPSTSHSPAPAPRYPTRTRQPRTLLEPTFANTQTYDPPKTAMLSAFTAALCLTAASATTPQGLHHLPMAKISWPSNRFSIRARYALPNSRL